MFQLEDTIVAISTAGGAGARAIVRLSGPEAVCLAQRVFQPVRGSLSEMGGFRAADGMVRMASVGIELPARAYVFRAPRSFTRQDLVEFHVPGAAPELADELISAGARQSEPGEFTARAFFSGRIDLSAATAVADVIDAADDAQLRAAIGSLGGRLERVCGDAASQIAEVLASVEASIDLADEDIELTAPADLADRLEALSGRLLETADQAELITESDRYPTVVLTGKANVGKSSLLNALSGTDRAIVSVLAGTTRDVLSATMSLTEGVTVRILDAAGFAHPTSPLDAASHKAARRAISGADVLGFVIDSSTDEEHLGDDLTLLSDIRSANSRAPVVVLANKADLLPSWEHAQIDELTRLTELPVIATSAISGEGLEEFRRRVTDLLQLGARSPAEAICLHQRQKRCLMAAANASQEAGEILRNAAEVSDVAEIAAVDLREALGQLGQITGQIVTEDILGMIFARFCVGK